MILQVAVEPEEDRFVAHCLEFDVASSGKSFQEAIENILDAIRTYLEACSLMGVDPRDIVRPAPREDLEEFQRRFFQPETMVSMVRLPFADLLPGRQEEAVALI